MSDIVRCRIVVHGRVQGVFYRDSTRRRAMELDLRGTVKNLADGTVEIIAEGPRRNLEALVRWAVEGPPAAMVSGVEVAWGKPTGEFPDFAVAYRLGL